MVGCATCAVPRSDIVVSTEFNHPVIVIVYGASPPRMQIDTDTSRFTSIPERLVIFLASSASRSTLIHTRRCDPRAGWAAAVTAPGGESL